MNILDRAPSDDLDVTWSYDSRYSRAARTPIPLRGAPHPLSFPDFEGIDVKRDLKPPSSEVLQNALSLLVEGTKAANQDYLSNPDEDPAFDRDAKGRLSEFIKVACQALIREADTESRDQRLQHDVEAAEYRRQRDNRLVDTHHRRNALLPIHQLPVEIFSNILVLVMHTSGLESSKFEPRLRQLASVAQHWKHLVLSTPRLWSFLHETMKSAFVRLSLHRSGNVPLDVCLWEESYHCITNTFRETILPFSHRWRSLEGPWPLSQALGKLELHTPVLQHLRLVARSAEELRLGEGLHLQTLELTGVSAPWNSGRISQLYKLSLTNIKGQHAPSLSQITHILACSPLLESLTLDGIEPLATPEDKHLLIGSISLPKLRSLNMLNLDMNVYNRLMACFQFPFIDCTNLRLEPNLPASPEVTDKYNYLADEFIQQVNCLAEEANAWITFRTQTVTLYVNSPNDGIFKLRMVVGQGNVEQKCVDGFNDAVTTLAQLVSAAMPDAPLTLSMLGDTHPNFSIDLLTRLPSTTKIELERDTVMRFLGQQLPNGLVGDDLAWPCPRLRELDIQNLSGHPIGDIRAWVKERWVKWKEPTNATPDGSSGTTAKPDGSVEVIMPFRKTRKLETWCPVQRTQNKKRPLRRKARAVYDDGEEDQEDD